MREPGGALAAIDWAVALGTLFLIVGYGIWKTRGIREVDAYLRGGRDVKWTTIGLSIMATQASAITFLSVPGQAYEDGMSFVQFYFGLPIAMVLLSATIVPVYHRLKVYTAYEYLETRFDLRTRQLTALIFLIQRGLAAGLSIYAPAIILSTVFGWQLQTTNLLIGGAVVLYTVSGGTRAVNQTQTHQMVVILGGMAAAFAFILHRLPPEVGLGDAVRIAGALGKMNVADWSLRLDTRYTVWSGLSGGLFVALAYFGTDQSQVQRYLSGGSLTESRLGLLFNGLVKVPMQAAILLVGLMVLVFYRFETPPIFFNTSALEEVRATEVGPELGRLEAEYRGVLAGEKERLGALLVASRAKDEAAIAAATSELRRGEAAQKDLREKARAAIKRARPEVETKDADYIFITFVTQHLPPGMVGLLLAVILCAAMSASASALNALGSTTMVDFYRRSFRPDASDAEQLRAAKLFTVLWGVVAVGFAAFATLLDNLIQAVNILGSIFYGPMLGVFVVGFFLKRVGAKAVFWSVIAAQLLVIGTFLGSSIGFLWYNVIGCAAVVLLALLLERLRPAAAPSPAG